MTSSFSGQARCLILACGNTLREDDGVGPFLALWAEERFSTEPRVRIIARQQWTPDLAADIAEAETVLFVDCSVEGEPGAVTIAPVEAASPEKPGLATHHVGAAELFLLSKELYGAVPRSSLLTVGAGSLELREGFSEAVTAALPVACARLEEAVLGMLRF